jgi:hypothetical protein
MRDSGLMKIRSVVLEIFHVNQQRAMTELVHNTCQIIVDSMPTGHVGSRTAYRTPAIY